MKAKANHAERTMLKSRESVHQALGSGKLTGKAAADAQRALEGVESEYRSLTLDFHLLSLAYLIAKTQSAGFSVIGDFIDEHFRTGFVRFAPATAIRNLLDAG